MVGGDEDTARPRRRATESFGGITGLLAASPGGDQPGARIEDHAALVAVVRREHFAQALDGTGRLAVAQGRERRAGALKPSDERERGLEVVSVEAGSCTSSKRS